MSAYIVETDTINAICSAVERYGLDLRIGSTWEHATAAMLEAYLAHGDRLESHQTDVIGQILLEQNYRSVNYRYSEEEVAPPFKTDRRREFSLGEMLGACHNYDYQACETPDYAATGIPGMLETIEYHISLEALARLGQRVPYGIDGHDMAERYQKAVDAK